ncbi:MAG: hypothetical protein AB8B73_13275 [Ekhidna sp.]
MKLDFLQKLFGSTKNEIKAPVKISLQQQKEVYKLIDAAVEEVIIDDRDSSLNSNEKTLTPYDIIKDPLLNEILNPKIEFKVYQEINGSTYEIDKQNNISRITWSGKVDLPTAKQLVTLGADSVEFYGYKKLLIDRSNLVEFDTEARLWIKEMLKTRAKKIVRMVDKLAIIKSNSAKGSIFSNLISSAIKIVMPNLKMEKFDNCDDALEWLK